MSAKPRLNSCKPLQECCCFPLDCSTSTTTQKLLTVEGKKCVWGTHPKHFCCVQNPHQNNQNNFSYCLDGPYKKYSWVITTKPGFVPCPRRNDRIPSLGCWCHHWQKGNKWGALCGLELNQNISAFNTAKAKRGVLLQAASYYSWRKPPWLFLLCIFLWAGIRIGMCGGCCQVLLKLALLHLVRVCLCSRTQKKQWQTVAAVTQRKRQAQSATRWIHLCRLQRCSPAITVGNSKTHNKKKELFQKQWKKKKSWKCFAFRQLSISPPTQKS